MYEDTPNQEYLNPFITRLREQYRIEKLRDWELNELKGEEWNIRQKVDTFRLKFPAPESCIQGDIRAYVNDDPSDTKRTLTDEEHERLDLVKEELIGNVKQARGIKREERRTYFERMLNKLIQLFQWIAMTAVKIRGRF